MTVPDIEAAIVDHRAGRLAEAEAVYRQILAFQPDNDMALYLLGTMANQLGNKDLAINLLSKSIAIEPLNWAAHNNLGETYRSIKRVDDSIICFQTAIKINPNYAEAYCNLGYGFYSGGELTDAVYNLKKAYAIEPNYLLPVIGAMSAQCYLGEMKEWPSFCNDALSRLKSEGRYTCLVFRAKAECALGNISALERTIDEAEKVKTKNPDLKNVIHYQNFLTKLLSYIKENPEIYSDKKNNILLVGDSHVLSYGGASIILNGVDYKINPHLIVGAKAWHMSNAHACSTSFDAYIDRLPTGSQLMLSFGEIDCRDDDGIIPYWKKSGGSLEDIVSGQVKRYVSSIVDKTKKKSLKLIFLAVPAPLNASSDRQKVISLFNTELRKNVLKSGHGCLDVYMATLDGSLHLDEYHIKPEVFRQCRA